MITPLDLIYAVIVVGVPAISAYFACDFLGVRGLSAINAVLASLLFWGLMLGGSLLISFVGPDVVDLLGPTLKPVFVGGSLFAALVLVGGIEPRGQGGIGRVFATFDRRLARQVARKELAPRAARTGPPARDSCVRPH